MLRKSNFNLESIYRSDWRVKNRKLAVQRRGAKSNHTYKFRWSYSKIAHQNCLFLPRASSPQNNFKLQFCAALQTSIVITPTERIEISKPITCYGGRWVLLLFLLIKKESWSLKSWGSRCKILPDQTDPHSQGHNRRSG